MASNIPAYSKDDITNLERAFSHLIRVRLDTFKKEVANRQNQYDIRMTYYNSFDKWLDAIKKGVLSIPIMHLSGSREVLTRGINYATNTELKSYWEKERDIYKKQADGFFVILEKAKKDLENEMLYLQPALTLLDKRELPNNFNPPEYLPNSNNTTATATRGGKKRRYSKTRKHRK
jgi:hypothetical protein